MKRQIIGMLSLAGLLAAHSASAAVGLQMSVQNTATFPGQSGFFDVLLSSVSGSYNIYSFNFEVSVPINSGISFTGVDVNTSTATYIFGTLQFPPLSFNTFPTTDVTGSDTDSTIIPNRVLNNVETVGLGRIAYTVDPGATPGDTMTITLVPNGSGVQSGDTFSPLGVSLFNGTITVAPEPSTMALLGVSGAILGLVARKRR